MKHLQFDRYDFPIANCVNLSHLKCEIDSIVWNCFFVRVLYDFLSIEPEIEIVVPIYGGTHNFSLHITNLYAQKYCKEK